MTAEEEAYNEIWDMAAKLAVDFLQNSKMKSTQLNKLVEMTYMERSPDWANKLITWIMRQTGRVFQKTKGIDALIEFIRKNSDNRDAVLKLLSIVKDLYEVLSNLSKRHIKVNLPYERINYDVLISHFLSSGGETRA